MEDPAQAAPDTRVRVSLDPYRTPGVKVFSGEERGRLVGQDIARRNREALLDGDLVVVVPADVFSVGHSFWRGLFLVMGRVDTEHEEPAGALMLPGPHEFTDARYRWRRYEGDYNKQPYCVRLRNGEVRGPCWPNAGGFHDITTRATIKGRDVVAYVVDRNHYLYDAFEEDYPD